MNLIFAAETTEIESPKDFLLQKTPALPSLNHFLTFHRIRAQNKEKKNKKLQMFVCIKHIMKKLIFSLNKSKQKVTQGCI